MISQSLPLSELLLRLFLALLAGAVVGWERESHGRPAGLRTTILASVAAALAMIISEIVFAQAAGMITGPDPARLASGVLTGIGFLGGGTILRHGDFVRGVTTAASLWFVTVIGLAFGCGQFVIGLIGTGIALLTLIALPAAEKFIHSDWYSNLSVTVTLDGLDERSLRQKLESLGLGVKEMKLSFDFAEKHKTFGCQLRMRQQHAFDLSSKTVAAVAACPGVIKVSWT
jgi:putative Mg2+ transporter-C (MgtC) family protein